MSSRRVDSGFSFLPRGAVIQEFVVGGRNIVQSFPTSKLYLESPFFFGETIGRTTNRIAKGVIQTLNGTTVSLPTNDGAHHLHGGNSGWGKKLFEGPTPVNRFGAEGVLFTYTSPNGEEGYPGTVQLRVWYTAYEATEEGISKTILDVEYEVELIGAECEETVVGVTNHSYFNLSGNPTVEGTEVIIHVDKHLVVDDTLIPTGAIEKFPTLEAGKPFTLDAQDPVIDACFVVDVNASNVPSDTRGRRMTKIATMSHAATNLHLEISSTEPAFQLYTGDYVDVPATETSPARPARCGVCVEPSRYVNAINVPGWRNMALLKRGQLWGARSIYKAWKA